MAGTVECNERLGGLLKSYYRKAAWFPVGSHILQCEKLHLLVGMRTVDAAIFQVALVSIRNPHALSFEIDPDLLQLFVEITMEGMNLIMK
ncbi:MAG: hypothetical protein V1754_06670 [Pseudomonadota bacterium]